MAYMLTLITAPVDRTHWWKDQNEKVPSNVWWLSGHGLNRPATDIEVDLWQQSGRKALQVVSPFNAFINIAAIGGTPAQVIAREFGIEEGAQ